MEKKSRATDFFFLVMRGRQRVEGLVWPIRREKKRHINKYKQTNKIFVLAINTSMCNCTFCRLQDVICYPLLL